MDLSPRMVELTAAEVTDHAQVQVLVGNAVAPDLPPSSFDVIASSLVLFFLPDPAGALARWADLLVPGGRLGISTFGPQDANWQRIDATFLPYLPKGMLDARTSGARGPFASDAGVEDLFRGVGLTDIRTVSQTVRATFRNAEHYVDFTWSIGQRAMWEAVPEAERPGLRQQITDLVDEVRGGYGRAERPSGGAVHLRQTPVSLASDTIAGRLVSVNVGLPKDVSWNGRTVHTGVWKRPVDGRRMVRSLNIDGDGQGDLGGHGGPHRAVLVYQLDRTTTGGRSSAVTISNPGRSARTSPSTASPTARSASVTGSASVSAVRGQPAPGHLLSGRASAG